MKLPQITPTQQYRVSPGTLKEDPEQLIKIEAGSVSWRSSNPAAADVFTEGEEVEALENELGEGEALVVAHGVGPYTITMKARADLGNGFVETITAEGTTLVSPGDKKKVVEISIGQTEDQPDSGSEAVPEKEKGRARPR